MQCRRCSSEFVPRKGLLNFCSIECRNTRVHSLDTRERISKGILSSEKYRVGIQKMVQNRDSDKYRDQVRSSWNSILYSRGWDNLGREGRKSLILHEQQYCCLECNLSTWNNKPIVLHLDHIDGNTSNNSRENLRCICPNCHSQTTTYCRKKTPSSSKDRI